MRRIPNNIRRMQLSFYNSWILSDVIYDTGILKQPLRKKPWFSLGAFSHAIKFWARGTSVVLFNWGQVTPKCVSDLTIIGSDNGLSLGRWQAIIWANAGILLAGSFFSLFKKMCLKMSSGKWRPFCLGLNVLTFWNIGKLRQDGQGQHFSDD